jgi:kynurenine 3-monooxygenase
MSVEKRNISIVGAGLVGSLWSIFVARMGHKVRLFEKRADLRLGKAEAGRSINLALSERGWRALEKVGVDQKIRDIALPMKGRMIHSEDGDLTFQPYGKEGQAIYSVSRSQLNVELLNEAEKSGVDIRFEMQCDNIDSKKCISVFEDHKGEKISDESDFIFGADGVFSAVRNSFYRMDRFDYQQMYLSHGYKELEIPAGGGGSFLLEPEYLHIWPRHEFMLIALPNIGGSFTCTLFFPFEGDPSFQSLEKGGVKEFFEETFPDAFKLMPDLEKVYNSNPSSSLVTVRCSPWLLDNSVCLIGDAAHAIVPFFGQGMNCGFEDCSVLNQILDESQGDWEKALQSFQKVRKIDADAISELALNNFIEMRDKVADPSFLLQKNIEARIQELYPEKWIPLYSRVTFSHRPYSEALEIGVQQQELIDKILSVRDIESIYKGEGFKDLLKFYLKE